MFERRRASRASQFSSPIAALRDVEVSEILLAHPTLAHRRPVCEFCFLFEATIIFPLRVRPGPLPFCRPLCTLCLDLAGVVGYHGVGTQRIEIMGAMWAGTKARDAMAALPAAFNERALRISIYSFLWSAQIVIEVD